MVCGRQKKVRVCESQPCKNADNQSQTKAKPKTKPKQEAYNIYDNNEIYIVIETGLKRM